MKKSILLLLTLGALAFTAHGTTYFLKSGGTNPPPLPMNPKPGYPVEQIGKNKFLVDDTLTDQQVLSRGLWLMETDSNGPLPPPPGEGGGSTNQPPPDVDTNAWIGTFIMGLPLPLYDGINPPAFPEPALWTITCANDGGSQFDHVKVRWASETRVCPGDTVFVLWPIDAATNPPGWKCFLIEQRGTNASGLPRTNWIYATMDNNNHDTGNWGAWTIPAPPLVGEDAQVFCGNGTNSLQAVPPDCCPNTNSVQSLTNKIVVCADLQNTDEGSGGPTATSDGGGALPQLPILIHLPTSPVSDPSCGWKTVPPVTDFPNKQPSSSGSCFTLPGPMGPADPTPPNWPYPPIEIWPYTKFPPVFNWVSLNTGDPVTTTFSSPDDAETVRTNTAWVIPLRVNALPNHSYVFQSSTNLTDWEPEGTTNVTFGSRGVEIIYLGTTNFTTAVQRMLEPSRFYRAVEAP